MDVEGGHVARVDRLALLLAVLHVLAREIDDRARLVLAEDAQIDVAHERLVLVRVLAARALDRRGTAHERTGLGVASHRLQQRGTTLLLLRQQLPGLAHDRLVFLAAPPGVAVCVAARRLPRGEDVVLRMAVQVDQPGHDHALGVDRPHPLGSTLADRGDIRALDDHVPIVDAIPGSEDNAAERERVTGLGAGSASEPLPLAQDRILWDGPADAGGVDRL
jgi:hypothetical protein